jgi:CDP-glucose 4,6-dehydratase
MNPSFWRGKTVFLTGHTGFKGSWLALLLNHLGATVTGYSLAPPTEPSLFETAGVARQVHHVLGDIRELAPLQQALAKAQPEIVIHMAAQSLVKQAFLNPVETYATNVMGTVNLLEAVRTVDTVQAVLVVTTDKCYANQEWPWGYREVDALGGDEPYANSKACAEWVTQTYLKTYFKPQVLAGRRLSVATARAGNVIGGGDWAADRLIPDAIQAFLAGKPVRIRHPKAERPWQYVLDALHGYLLLIERLWEQTDPDGGSWNFGPDPQAIQPVSWVLDQLVRLWGGGAAWEYVTGSPFQETQCLRLDSTQARQRLGWQPRLDLPATLEAIVRWHRQHQETPEMAAYCQAEIQRFLVECAYEPVR